MSISLIKYRQKKHLSFLLRHRRAIAAFVLLMVITLFTHEAEAQDGSSAAPHVVLITGEIIDGPVEFSRRSLRNNFITVNQKRYRLSIISHFSDGQHVYGRTSTNLILRRVESGRIGLFTDFDWTNSAPIYLPRAGRIAKTRLLVASSWNPMVAKSKL